MGYLPTLIIGSKLINCVSFDFIVVFFGVALGPGYLWVLSLVLILSPSWIWSTIGGPVLIFVLNLVWC